MTSKYDPTWRTPKGCPREAYAQENPTCVACEAPRLAICAWCGNDKLCAERSTDSPRAMFRFSCLQCRCAAPMRFCLPMAALSWNMQQKAFGIGIELMSLAIVAGDDRKN